MRLARLLYECAFFGGACAIGLAWAWQDDWTEALCGVATVIIFLVVNGASPLGWLAVIAMASVTPLQWDRFTRSMQETFGPPLEGRCAWAMAMVAFVVFVVTYFVNGLLLLPFDLWAWAQETAKPYKIQPSMYMATLQPGKLARSLAINMVVVLVYVHFMLAEVLWSGGARGIKLDGFAHLPSKQEHLCSLLLGLAWNEVMFYYSHRLMHHKKFYGRFHKKHHEYTAPFALAAIYCGPVEMVVSNLWPFLGSASCFRFHIYFIYCWVVNAVLGTQTHHSGHKWPWMTCLDHQPHIHDLHHELFNVNFGNMGMFDKMHGTFRDPSEARSKRCKDK